MTEVQTSRESPVAALYDDLAGSYDSRYDDDLAASENATYASWLSSPSLPYDSVLDLGCGTGLLLDLLGDVIDPRLYVGVDPSEGMLARHRAKHPEYVSVQQTAEEYLDVHAPWASRGMSWDLIVAGFGAASYIDPDVIAHLPNQLSPHGVGLLMTYKRGYLPDYHDIVPPTLDTSRLVAISLGKTTEWHNFDVTVFRRWHA